MNEPNDKLKELLGEEEPSFKGMQQQEASETNSENPLYRPGSDGSADN